MIQIIVKISPRENLKVTVPQQITVEDLNNIISNTKEEYNYIHKNRILQPKLQLINQDVQEGDLIIQTIKERKKSKLIELQEMILDNAEDYKKKVLELIEQGYKREDVVQAMIHNKYDLQQVMTHLIYGKRRANYDQNQVEVDAEEVKEKLMNLEELQLLIKCIKSEDWVEEFYQLQQRKREIFDIFMQNTMALVELIAELLSN
ncbi:unnamed protein product (macronuclear) [Paramecium tetraurelia]|uniref:UBA domain-containing protein n=1 Tax=Paramecium tetraurelia TaxID=5888 RepID=A0CH79_PARTE|nr:uncharacterized protein GSPATT00007586001 [Paramecium tetraurelia]CAK70146.1 unnamed protein product [Paramecium tetraurelia]|eukprot:XP_001437543.1 hypothetical protein (macronuclear) [Paramecium tetraurelia strain d4-2]